MPQVTRVPRMPSAAALATTDDTSAGAVRKRLAIIALRSVGCDEGTLQTKPDTRFHPGGESRQTVVLE